MVRVKGFLLRAIGIGVGFVLRVDLYFACDVEFLGWISVSIVGDDGEFVMDFEPLM